MFEGHPGISHVFTDNETVPRFDVHLPVASLGAVFASTLATIPATVPYVHASPPLSEAWRQKLAPFAGQLKVGLAWAGRPTHKNDRNRSQKLEQFAALAAPGITNVTFFSLQKGPASSQAANPPAGMRLVDFSAELQDFTETAALIDNLDMVICVDTAVAHLAEAMWRSSVWVMIPSNPDWRWMLNQRKTRLGIQPCARCSAARRHGEVGRRASERDRARSCGNSTSGRHAAWDRLRSPPAWRGRTKAGAGGMDDHFIAEIEGSTQTARRRGRANSAVV